MPTIDTKTAPRRDLHFATLEDALADARRLAAAPVRTTGNRTAGDLVGHLAQSIDVAIDGLDPATLPLPVRLVGRLFGNLIGKRIASSPMRPGFQTGPKAEAIFYPAEPGDLQTAVDQYEASITRLRACKALPRHPLFGALDHDRTEQIHCRHAELHLSFIHPIDG